MPFLYPLQPTASTPILKVMADTFEKYGLLWRTGTDALLLEFKMIQIAPPETKARHYLAVHRLLWPEDQQHRWFTLGLKTIVENKVSVFLGCASSGKTYTMAVHALIDFFCFPHTSLSLISSTEKRSLELKVWGRVKELFNRAKNRYGWLPGYVLESSMVIAPDDIDEDNERARELNRGIVCFPTGTMVDTPTGPRRIESIKPGDEVVNAFGVGVVEGTISSKFPRLVRINLSDGRTIDCTPEHPFFTRRGWVKAVDLTNLDMVLSVHETMQIMRGGFRWKMRKPEVLQCGVQIESAGNGNLRKLWKNFQTFEIEPVKARDSFLLRSLRWKVGGKEHKKPECKNIEMQKMRQVDAGSSQQSKILLNNVPERFKDNALPSMRKKVHVNSRNIYKAENSVLFQILQKESDWSSERETACDTNKLGINSLGHVHRFDPSFSSANWAKNFGRKISLVSTGPGIPRNKIGSRNRRWSTPQARARAGGQEKNWNFECSRVDRVEVLERSGDKRFIESEGGYTVHNLEVAGHPSYSVNGVMVHNCVPCVSGGRFIGMGKFQGAKPPHSPGKNDGILKHYGDEAAVMQTSFLDAYTNWTVSPGFKGVMSGNPTDISDPLCIAAEPEGGWDAFVDTGKTQEWTSQWYHAAVIAFDGRDTPNNDDPNVLYPFLLTAEWVESLRKTHGDDSWQLFQQGIGKPSRGMVSNRVITIGLCQRNKAFDATIFKDDQFTDIGALDPAYGGGDRCVWGTIRLGTALDGTSILEVHEPEIIPIRLNSSLEPEEQIADYVFARAQQGNIGAQNIFYDSFGRGTLGAAFARVFGSVCPVPVDSGARPTNRPVRFDLFVEERDGTKRLKRCDEHYSKFVTEMWFSTREAIESQQVRNLPRNVADEGQLRLFEIVQGNKIEVESKDDMKERVRKSPDLYDWFSIAVEGARQRNFKIKRIGQAVDQKRKPDALDKMLKEFKEARNSKLLLSR
jgi:hypothetical protein